MIRTITALFVFLGLIAASGYSAWRPTCERPSPVDSASPAERHVTVRVTDDAGRPVAEALVEALAVSRSITVARTDINGEAHLVMSDAAEVAWIVALKPGQGLDYFECRLIGRPPVTVPDEIGLRLDGARSVRIRAVDSHNTPLAGVRFSPWIISRQDKQQAVNLSASFIASATTDDAGVVSFDWIPGRSWDEPGATFLVQSPGFHWPDPPEDIYPGDDALAITAKLHRATTVSGAVEFPGGRGAIGMLVQAEGRGACAPVGRVRTRTTLGGAYTLALPPGQTYTITIIDDDWTATRAQVAVRENEPVEGVDLNLTRGSLIHGRMTTEDGRAVAGELVLLGVETGDPGPEGEEATSYWDQFAGVTLQRSTLTDAEGRYAFRVGPGRYLICGVGATPGGIHGPERITIPDEAPKDVRFDFTRVTSIPVLGTTAAPFRVTPHEVYEYAFRPADLKAMQDSDRACMQCHRPQRGPVSIHGD